MSLPLADLIIRPFEPADQDAARTLVLAGLEEHFGRLDLSLNLDLNDIASAYRAAGHLFIVAEVAGRLVGTAGLLIEEQGSGELVRISVAKAWRGQGVGRALVATMVRHGWERGLRDVTVETHDNWLDALNLYQRCGFIEFQREGGHVYLRWPQV